MNLAEADPVEKEGNPPLGDPYLRVFMGRRSEILSLGARGCGVFAEASALFSVRSDCVLLPVALHELRGSDQDQRPRVVWRQGGQGCSETTLTFGDPGARPQFLRRVSWVCRDSAAPRHPEAWLRSAGASRPVHLRAACPNASSLAGLVHVLVHFPVSVRDCDLVRLTGTRGGTAQRPGPHQLGHHPRALLTEPGVPGAREEGVQGAHLNSGFVIAGEGDCSQG